MSFRDTAVAELFEESGLRVKPDDLIPFASLSDPAVHQITYPNGDRVHCFALCFEARLWSGELRPGADEVREARFFKPGELPEPLQPQTKAVWDLYCAFRATGAFQACSIEEPAGSRCQLCGKRIGLRRYWVRSGVA